MEDKELIKKCESHDFTENDDVVKQCQTVLNNIDQSKEELGLTEEQTQTYLKMLENLKPQDVSKVLDLALKIRESGKVKNTEIKVAASRLARSIEMG